MRQRRVHSGLRYGLPSALVIAALGSADALLQARRHAIGPSARWLVVFAYLFVVVVAVLLQAVGFLSTRRTGRAKSGMWAGAVAAGLPFSLFTAIVTLQTAKRQGQLNNYQIAGYVIAILLFVAAGGIAGALVSLPGALVGRARFRSEHPEEVAARAA
jgi:hypothetical protein